MQAIHSKYLPATNTRCSRIKATCERGSIVIGKTYIITTDSVCGKTTARDLREAFSAFRLPFATASQWEDSIAAVGGYGTITEDGVVIARVSA